MKTTGIVEETLSIGVAPARGFREVDQVGWVGDGQNNRAALDHSHCSAAITRPARTGSYRGSWPLIDADEASPR